MQYIYDKDGVLSETIFPETPGFGVQIPVNGIEIKEALPVKTGYVWLYKNGEITQVKDNRGTYYLKETGEAFEFNEYGDVPDMLTKKAPYSPYDKWDGKKWVKDEDAEKQALKLQAVAQRDNYLAIASEKIAPLQDAVDIDEATDEEINLLRNWKKYRVLLNRIEKQEEFPLIIIWPEMPA